MHLASVLAVGTVECVLAVWDQRLSAGAKAVGVRVAPVGEDDEPAEGAVEEPAG
ncbi:hypothetical protein BH20ACT5_BH20ACT5_10460 [soil metagenome]